MFGPDLLAAPVLEPGARGAPLDLPRGRWVDLWRSVRFRARGGGLALGRARMLAGGRGVTLPAPLDELPLLARAGALLPLLPPDVDTLAAYGDRARRCLAARARAAAACCWPSRAGAPPRGSRTAAPALAREPRRAGRSR